MTYKLSNSIVIRFKEIRFTLNKYTHNVYQLIAWQNVDHSTDIHLKIECILLANSIRDH